jgi:lytic murein transglycosylase
MRFRAGWTIGVVALLAGALTLAPLRATSAEADIAAYKRAVDAGFATWLEGLWPDAEAAGISRAIFDANVKGLKLDWSLPHLVYPDPGPGGVPLPASLAAANKPKAQPEFDVPANYFKEGAMNSLAATGRAKSAQLRPTLAGIQKKFDVPASIVVAIWGRETGFGQEKLPYDALSAIATQAYLGRRPDEFRKQLIGILKILQNKHATRAEMKGSWAGAMGYTQLLPTDFEKYGVDFDGDGRRDIWGSVPDALASAANSLHTQGWDGSVSWGYEVFLPKGFDCTVQGPDQSRPIADWLRLGAVRVKGQNFAADKLGKESFLVLPAGLKGPAFLATTNFSVLKLYNNSDVYAIFVGRVADMIAGSASAKFEGAWLPVERLSRDRIQAFQEVLVSQGHDVGKVDGLAGFKTRAAIGKKEKELGLPLTCYPSARLVDAVMKQKNAAN